MSSDIKARDYVIHGAYFAVYGIFKYLPSPVGDFFRKHVSKVFLKKSGAFRIYEGVTLWYPYRITIGSRVTLNEWVYISGYGGVTIGNDVRIGHRTSIVTSDHRFDDDTVAIHQQGLTSQPVVIEDNVFIGCNATILSGVTIGAGSVIGAGTVLTRSVGPNSIVVGNPGRVIGVRGADELS